MRLPTDATLLIGEGADPECERVWREERLPVLTVGADIAGLEADLEAIGTATVVAVGGGAQAAAAAASRLGFRTFLVGDGPSSDAIRTVARAQALEAARGARARERWLAARRA